MTPHFVHAALALSLALTVLCGRAADGPPAEASGAASVAPAASSPSASLDTRVQDLKAEVLRLNRDLLVLEEDLLFPPGTQVAVFVSLDVGLLFELESVRVLLDDQVVASQLYTPLQVQALRRGGMQRVYLGNLRTGKHTLTAYFTGRGPAHADDRRDYKRAAQLAFDKGSNPQYIELRIRDQAAKLQPEFEVKVWP
jgi:hypothetical protein